MSYRPKQSIIEGYEKFVIRNPIGCWDWNGCVPKNPGYGQFRSGMKIIRAHRASWMINFGKIPQGMYVCHKCDNKRCSNPDHLFLATHTENISDMMDKGLSPILCKKGSDNPNSKLNLNDIDIIKNMIGTKVSQSKIAKKFGVSQVLISRIKLKKAWR